MADANDSGSSAARIDALIVHEGYVKDVVHSSRTVAFLSGDAAVMYVHDDSSAQQLIAQCHEGSAYGVFDTILPKTHPFLPPTLTMMADSSDPYVSV